MSWVKLDDQFAQHPKIMAAGPVAAWLHVSALCYCAKYLTDGAIPERALSTLIDTTEVEANVKQLASHLVDVGLWNRSENGYEIHDYLDFNPTREEVLATREKRSDAGKVGGLRSGQARREANSEAKTKQSAKQTRSKTPSKNEAKSNPVPVPHPHVSTSNEVEQIKPWDLFEAMCDEAGQDYSMIGDSLRGRQLSAAKQLVDTGATPDEIRREMRWLSDQAWVNGAVDMPLLASQWSKWVLAGKPDKVIPKNQQGSVLDGTKPAFVNGRQNYTEDEGKEYLRRHGWITEQ